MKKRTHTHTHTLILKKYFFFMTSPPLAPCCGVGAFFDLCRRTKSGRPKKHIFFPFFFVLTKYSSLSLSLSLSLSVFYYRVTKRSTHPAAGEKEKRKKEETRVQSLLLALLFHRARSSCSLCAAISYVFFLV